MTPIAPVLIIGGGPAGAACAIRLAQQGIATELAEKTAFPRSKVCGCCLGGSGIETLQRLNLDQWTMQNGVPIAHWTACIDSRVIDMPLPTGIAISRQALDTRMIAEAERHGVSVMRECTAEIKHVGKTVLTTLNDQQREYACVVIAAGLNAAGGGRILPWIEKPHGPFGVSFTVPRSDDVKRGVIYMICDADGYVGLVQLESGRVDIAAAIQSGAQTSKIGTPMDRVKRILSGSLFASLDMSDHSKVLTTPPLRRTRIAGRGAVLAIGDSAGYVEPFTGEGMTWAMKSGIAAADCISRNENTLAQAGDEWARLSPKLLRSQKRTCRAITSALNWSPTRRLIGLGLKAAPGIAKPLIARLNR